MKLDQANWFIAIHQWINNFLNLKIVIHKFKIHVLHKRSELTSFNKIINTYKINKI